MKKAIVDLGTNTFQLLIIEIQNNNFTILHESSIPTHLGKGGISKGIITQEAIQRAINALLKFKVIGNTFNLTDIDFILIGCSALRNAQNNQEVLDKILYETGFTTNIIDGITEANFILEGVKKAVNFNSQPFLIMDIGGGSVEFIIANTNKIYYKQSFEIGGQRLMDMFFDQDPMPAQQVKNLQNYLQLQLLPLANALHQYNTSILVGSSGSFDTLVDMYRAANNITTHLEPSSNLPMPSFYHFYQQFLTLNKQQRLQMNGMLAMRAEMIVVATVLIDYVLKLANINRVIVSHYSLKEGVAAVLVQNGTLPNTV